MIPQTQSKVEQYYLNKASLPFLDLSVERIPTLVVENYAILGQLTALRFLEWLQQNPEGVAALPTGKTPEFFIKWMQYYLANWQKESSNGLLAEIGIGSEKVPSLGGLHFVQLDEFFPMKPTHQRSFRYYVEKYYLDSFGMDRSKALLIDAWNFQNASERLSRLENLGNVFPDGTIDLSTRFKKPTTWDEEIRFEAIRHFDDFCESYEAKIHDLGGIGFFLGGIGPDGHIAFNIRGSSRYSTTRLTKMNYETQAAAASDLGGIHEARKRAVITMGLGTITHNPDCTAVIMASGQAKAKVVNGAITEDDCLQNPANALQALPNARFYISEGASGGLLERRRQRMAAEKNLSEEQLGRLVFDGALKTKTRIEKIDEKIDPDISVALKASGKSAQEVSETLKKSILQKIEKGLKVDPDKVYWHTAPHHDDIELAYFPNIHHLAKKNINNHHFSYMTSGFNAVTHQFFLERITAVHKYLKSGEIWQLGEQKALIGDTRRQDEIVGYLNAVAAQNTYREELFEAARIYRKIYEYVEASSDEDVLKFIDEQFEIMKALPPGKVEPLSVQKVKGWIREWEAELVWAFFGMKAEQVSHLGLEFYKGEIFPEDPEHDRDVLPILKQLEKLKPNVVTLALDPEGSGPDTHFKVLMATAAALDEYVKKYGDDNLEIWGYRNVWTRFHLSEVDTVIPVSLNSMPVLDNMFVKCFRSQKSAEFPSAELDGTFSELAQKIWVEQFDELRTLLGNSFFYRSDNAMLRRAYGAIFMKRMSYKEFASEMENMKKFIQSKKSVSTSDL